MILNSYFSKSADKVYDKSKGNYLYDNKGHKYLDCSFGSGTLLFGHSDKDIITEISNQSKISILSNQNHKLAQSLDKDIINFFKKKREHFVYCNTGSEASQRAIRYAREYNNKEKVLSFFGYWHGMNEWTLDGGGMTYSSVTKNVGIPKIVNKNKIQINFDLKEIEKTLIKYHKSISSLIIEPIPGSNPKKPDLSTLNEIIMMCKKYNIVTIFDEVISGFRCNKQGISYQLVDLPDIIIYGKSLGGGLPIGLVSLSKKIAAATFLKKNSQTLAGGTFSLNPLVSRVAIKFLKKINEHKFKEEILAEKFRNNLNKYFIDQKLDLKIVGYSSISRLIFTKDKFDNKWKRIEKENSSNLRIKFLNNIKKKKIIYPKNGLLFHSTLYKDKEFNFLKKTILECL